MDSHVLVTSRGRRSRLIVTTVPAGGRSACVLVAAGTTTGMAPAVGGSSASARGLVRTRRSLTALFDRSPIRRERNGSVDTAAGLWPLVRTDASQRDAKCFVGNIRPVHDVSRLSDTHKTERHRQDHAWPPDKADRCWSRPQADFWNPTGTHKLVRAQQTSEVARWAQRSAKPRRHLLLRAVSANGLS